MNHIKRNGKSVLMSGKIFYDIKFKSFERATEDKVSMTEACKIGLHEFLDINSELLSDVSMLTRILFLNKIRRKILESLFFNRDYAFVIDKNLFFDYSIFTERERTFVIFNINKISSYDNLLGLKQFIHDNFRSIRSEEDILKLLEEDENVQ